MEQQQTFQPVSDLQLNQLVIEWVPRDSVKPNKYNPNKMTYQDRMLLRQSILEDGWTQPIVTLMDGTIVDGEQRWTVAGLALTTKDIQEIIDKMEERKKAGFPESDSILFRLNEGKKRLEQALLNEGIPGTLVALTGGLVPITRVDFGDDAHKMISTIRHNRARGSHGIDQMSLITQDLMKLGLDVDDLEVRLGMDDEEIKRMVKAAEGMLSEMTEVAATHSFSPSTDITHLADLNDPTIQAQFAKSARANQAFQVYEDEKRRREQQINAQKEQSFAALPENANQDDKDALIKRISDSIPEPEKPKLPELRKFIFFVLPDEYNLFINTYGDNIIQGLLALTRMVKKDPELKARMLAEMESH